MELIRIKPEGRWWLVQFERGPHAQFPDRESALSFATKSGRVGAVIEVLDATGTLDIRITL